VDDRPQQEAPPARPEEFLTKDRAKRFVYRLEQLARERSSFYAAARIGMTSFAEAVPTMLAIEDDMAETIDAVLESRLRDRERGETEIPFVVALEGVLERVRRAREVETRRRDGTATAEPAQKRVLALLADAVRRLNAFAEVYDAERFLPLPASTDVGRVVERVEADAALDAVPGGFPAAPGPPPSALDRRVPRIVTCSDALEDLLRAARSEVGHAPPPWRARKDGPAAPLTLSIGDEATPGTASPSTPAAPLGSLARTERAREVLSMAHAATVARIVRADDSVGGVAVTVADSTGTAVARKVAPEVALPAEDDAAVRAYLLAAAASSDLTAPARMVATMGLMKAVERALARTLGPVLASTAATVVLRAVPREGTRKAPVRREVTAALADAVPGLPVQRASDLLEEVAAGKTTAAIYRTGDAATLLAVLGRSWPGPRPFGERVIGAGSWTDDDAVAAARDALAVARIRSTLEKGGDPGAHWPAALESAAIGLFTRLARAR
jgi:hypothetical protein